jgi:putative transposase
MAKSIRDPQLRLRIYHTTFASMRRAIVEKAREYGVPVIPVNPAFTSSKCPIHGAKIEYQPDGSTAPRVGRCPVGGELWHRDMASLYNLKNRVGYGSRLSGDGGGLLSPPSPSRRSP